MRSIRCVFEWQTLSQIGYVHYKFAPFDLSGITKKQDHDLDQTHEAGTNHQLQVS